MKKDAGSNGTVGTVDGMHYDSPSDMCRIRAKKLWDDNTWLYQDIQNLEKQIEEKRKKITENIAAHDMWITAAVCLDANLLKTEHAGSKSDIRAEPVNDS